MTDPDHEQPSANPPFLRDPANKRWLASAGILAIGLTLGGYLLGNGLLRAREADRSVPILVVRRRRAALTKIQLKGVARAR